jgi:DNA-binding transcriptional LysR family regulator
LRCLREVAHRGSIAAAADALWLTPSAVSQQIAALQKETGVQLLERAGRGVTLTPAARALVARSERVFEALGEAEATLSTSQVEPLGHIRVAMLPSLVRVALPVMEAMRAEHADLDFDLECGRIDVAVADWQDWAPAQRRYVGLEATELFADPVAVVYAPRYDLPSGELRWEHLADEPWVVGQPPWSFLKPIFHDYERAGSSPSVVARVRDLATALGLVREGWGVTALPRLAVAGSPEDIAWQVPKPLVFRRMVALTRPQGATVPAIRMLIERVCAESDRLPMRSG